MASHPYFSPSERPGQVWYLVDPLRRFVDALACNSHVECANNDGYEVWITFLALWGFRMGA